MYKQLRVLTFHQITTMLINEFMFKHSIDQLPSLFLDYFVTVYQVNLCNLRFFCNYKPLWPSQHPTITNPGVVQTKCSKSPHSSDWFLALPISAFGSRLYDENPVVHWSQHMVRRVFHVVWDKVG